MTEKTVISQIVERAEQCGEKHQQCWLSNEKFNEFAKEVGNLSINEKGQLMFVQKGAKFNLKIEIALEKCQTANAFAKLLAISEVNWYTGIEIKSVFKYPENSKEIVIL